MNSKTSLLNYSVTIILLITMLLSCDNNNQIKLPDVITDIEVRELNPTNAISGGVVTSENGEPVSSKGVCWSIIQEPTIKDSLTKNGVGVGAFESKLFNLIPNTKYFIRAYAINKFGIAYGNTVEFSTPIDSVSIITKDITNITANTAICGGSITNDGKGSIIAKGVCWSKSNTPTISDYKTNDGSGKEEFVSNITNLNSGTNYFLRSYATNEKGTFYGNTQTFKTLAKLPTLNSTGISFIKSNEAQCYVQVTSDGGGAIIQKGLCWSTTINPTISDSKTNDKGPNIGSFGGILNGLSPGVKYYVKGYATNSAGTSYTQEMSFTTFSPPVIDGTVTDINGNVYNTIKIGTQTWMVENLKTTKFRNGDLIDTTTPANQDISTQTSPVYQWSYDGNETNVDKHGRLYTWYAIYDNRNLAPEGWHVATQADWDKLSETLQINGYNFDGSPYSNYGTNKLAKSIASKTDWNKSSTVGAIGNNLSQNNSSGITAYPSGRRSINGKFGGFAIGAEWWCYTNTNTTTSRGWSLDYSSIGLNNYSSSKSEGKSVRCVKDLLNE